MCQEKQKINIPKLIGRLVRESEIVNTKHGNLIMTRVLKVSSAMRMHTGTLAYVGSQERLL